jgi:hypothetical protein
LGGLSVASKGGGFAVVVTPDRAGVRLDVDRKGDDATELAGSCGVPTSM